MKTLHSFGKYLYLTPFAVFGVFHFMNADAMSGMVPAFLPFKLYWVYLTGITLIAPLIAVILGKKVRLAFELLGLMLLLFAVLIHLPKVIEGDQMAMPMFLKDVALAGAAWFAAKTQIN